MTNQSKWVSTTKFLGVHLDDSFTWRDHNSYVTNIVSKYTGILYRLKHVLSSKCFYLHCIQHWYCLTYKYCNIIWADNNNSNLNAIHVKQKKIVRLCTNSHYLANSKPLFLQLKTLTVYDVHKYQVSLFMYKYHKKLLPALFDNYFKTADQVHSYPTRTSSHFRPHIYSSDLARNTIKTKGPLLWNAIIPRIRSSKSIEITF